MTDRAVPPYETLHSLHGNLFRVRGGLDVVMSAAVEALGPSILSDDAERPPFEIILHEVTEASELPRPASSAQFIANPPQVAGSVLCTLLQDQTRWILQFENTAIFFMDLQAGTVEGWLRQPIQMPRDALASFLVTAAIELLRTREVYAIHGAALARDGAGVLIVGRSGSGKTTACLSLARAGYQCLSDDHPLFRWRDGQPELLSFPGRILATDRTIDWFPELAAARPHFRQDSRKRSFQLQDIPGYSPGSVCTPRALLFSRIAECAESVLEPISKSRALEELLPQTLLVMDAKLAARQFQAMTALVRAVPAYRLHFGDNPERLPDLVQPLLEPVSVA